MHRLLRVFSHLHLHRPRRALRRCPLPLVSCPPAPAPAPGPGQLRYFADTPKTDVISKKQIVVHQGTENDKRLRVRRARPSDVPRVLRFVREHTRLTWPNFAARAQAGSAAHIALCDYVSRALAQGHSMVAEQHETKRGWLQIKGLALGLAVCPWDATVLERWARCVRCQRSKRLVQFTAHCLRAPGLHEKYRVHNILQVILIVPKDTQSTEVVRMLTNNAIKRGRDVGFPLLRFDVTNEDLAKALEDMELTKEWYISFDVVPETDPGSMLEVPPETRPDSQFIAVYTALTKEEKAQEAKT